jgi:hypothetical protein
MKVAHSVTITDPDTFSDSVVSGSSVFDPLTGLGSDQPAFYDVFASMYAQYRVIRSRIKVSIQQVVFIADTGEAINYRLSIAPRTSATAFSSADDMTVQPYSRTRVVSPSSSIVSVQSSMETARMFGLGDVEKTSVQVQAAVTANPAAEWFWHVTSLSTNAATSRSISLMFELEYDVEFYNRVAGGESFLPLLTKAAQIREDYLKLKALTPNRDGRIPATPPLEELKEFVATAGRPSALVVDKSPSTPSRGWERVEHKAAAPVLSGLMPRK